MTDIPIDPEHVKFYEEQQAQKQVRIARGTFTVAYDANHIQEHLVLPAIMDALRNASLYPRDVTIVLDREGDKT